MIGKCPICEKHLYLTKHHLIPRTTHTSKWFKNHCSKEDKTRYFYICFECHSGIHDLFDEKELARQYNTEELLMATEQMKNYKIYALKRKVKEVFADGI